MKSNVIMGAQAQLARTLFITDVTGVRAYGVGMRWITRVASTKAKETIGKYFVGIGTENRKTLILSACEEGLDNYVSLRNVELSSKVIVISYKVVGNRIKSVGIINITENYWHVILNRFKLYKLKSNYDYNTRWVYRYDFIMQRRHVECTEMIS